MGATWTSSSMFFILLDLSTLITHFFQNSSFLYTIKIWNIYKIDKASTKGYNHTGSFPPFSTWNNTSAKVCSMVAAETASDICNTIIIAIIIINTQVQQHNSYIRWRGIAAHHSQQYCFVAEGSRYNWNGAGSEFEHIFEMLYIASEWVHVRLCS